MSDEPSRDASLDAIRSAYERYAREGRRAMWDRTNPGYRRLADQRDDAVIALLRSCLPGGDYARLLDVGSGGGDLAVLARSARLNVKVVGIDLLEDRVEAARATAPWATFELGSADDLPFEDHSFDLAAALTLFSSLPTPNLESAVAREIARVVRPRGWLLWYDIRVSNPWNPRVHGIDRTRLAELFPGWELAVRSMTVLPPVARRLGRSTPFVYPLLHAVPLLRSHLVGCLRRPGT